MILGFSNSGSISRAFWLSCPTQELPRAPGRAEVGLELEWQGWSRMFPPVPACPCSLGIRGSQGLEGTSGDHPAQPLPRQAHLDQVTQGHIQVALESLQKGRRVWGLLPKGNSSLAVTAPSLSGADFLQADESPKTLQLIAQALETVTFLSVLSASLQPCLFDVQSCQHSLFAALMLRICFLPLAQVLPFYHVNPIN